MGRRSKALHSVDDSLGMKVFQTVEDLGTERLRHVVVKSTMLSQDTSNRSTRNIFKEARKLSVI